MKTPVMIVLLLTPVIVFAQNYQGMNAGDMQKMMQQMQKMTSCIQNIDQQQIKTLEQSSRLLQAEVKTLCDSGNREEAQAKAISFGKKIVKHPTMLAMRKCGEMMKEVMKGKMKEMMKAMVPESALLKEQKDFSKFHVCDSNAVN